jgi:hypothetical protein
MLPSAFRTAPPHTTMTDDIQRFIARWQASGAAGRANYQLFLSELCDVLNAPPPDPTTPDEASKSCRRTYQRYSTDSAGTYTDEIERILI